MVTCCSRRYVIAALAILTTGIAVASADEPPRPNIVVVLADDLGYGDLGCFGHPRIKTPRLDEFAAAGLKLTSCYASAPNCSPSRTGLMTGRTPFRVGVYNWIPMFSPVHVPRSEVTIATLLRNSGYDTAHVGKWHLNGDFNLPSQPQPWDHGFNHWFSTQNNALPNHRNPVNFVRNGVAVGALRGYSSKLVVDESIEWLEHGRDTAKPFFLFVCFHEPHEPIATADQFAGLYPSDDPSLSAHHGNVSQMDHAFGRVVDTLDRLQLRENTFVFFTSDNGPAITGMHPHGSAGQLRDKKGHVSEGGIRVPGMVQWPGVVEAGTISDQPVCGLDLLPTLCDMTDVAIPDDRALDGASFVPMLRGEMIKRSKPLYWQFNRSSGDIKVAIRDGDWKLSARLTVDAPQPGGGIPEGEFAAIKSGELTGFELYNLTQDVAESNDVKAKQPQRFAAMKHQMIQQFLDVQQEAPEWPLWEWPRYESEQIEWPDYWLNRKRR
jgi:arylsulfatase